MSIGVDTLLTTTVTSLRMPKILEQERSPTVSMALSSKASVAWLVSSEPSLAAHAPTPSAMSNRVLNILAPPEALSLDTNSLCRFCRPGLTVRTILQICGPRSRPGQRLHRVSPCRGCQNSNQSHWPPNGYVRIQLLFVLSYHLPCYPQHP